MRFIAELDIQIRAKAALILIRTPEEARVQGEILSFAANTGRELISWDICAGFTPLRGKNAPDGGRDPLAALEAIDKAAPDRAALFLLKDFNAFWDNPTVRRRLRTLSQTLRQSRKTILITTVEDELPIELRNEAVEISFELPDAFEINAEIDRLRLQPGTTLRLSETGRERLVRAALGLTSAQAQRAFAKAIARSGFLSDEDIAAVAEEKKKTLLESEALEYTDANEPMQSVGGLDILKDWLEMSKPVKNTVSKTDNPSSDKSHVGKSTLPTQNNAGKVTDLSDDNNNAAQHQNNKSVSPTQPAAEKGTTATAHIHNPAEGKQSESGDYKVYESKQYGRYINVNDFGADPTGKKDSLAAIKAALEAAHKEKAMLFMDGTYYISDQIVIDNNTSGVKGIFGAGMGKTQINFDKAQVGIFNSNTNHDDVRAFAGILVDGQNGKTIADLSVRYTNADFYRKGLSYFGKVNGILVNDADNTLISKVEVSGANRAGVTFTSTAALMREAGYKLSYKDRVANGSIDDKYDSLPLGENNRIVDSNLHHNRVAGALVSYQKNFLGEGNLLSWNGHQDDGGTGYGIAAAAGSYNYGITYRKNTTDHNYRKGLDVHDGTDVLIENNTLNGDRLYGIAVYNRQFSLDNVKISGNVITQDSFSSAASISRRTTVLPRLLLITV